MTPKRSIGNNHRNNNIRTKNPRRQSKTGIKRNLGANAPTPPAKWRLVNIGLTNQNVYSAFSNFNKRAVRIPVHLSDRVFELALRSKRVNVVRGMLRMHYKPGMTQMNRLLKNGIIDTPSYLHFHNIASNIKR